MLSDEQLEKLINTLPFAAHLREVETGRYILANQQHATNHGFQEVQAVIGITYQDIYYHRRSELACLQGKLHLEDQHKVFIDAINARADRSQSAFHCTTCTLFPTGFIYYGMLKKIPLTGAKQSNYCCPNFLRGTYTRTGTVRLV